MICPLEANFKDLMPRLLDVVVSSIIYVLVGVVESLTFSTSANILSLSNCMSFASLPFSFTFYFSMLYQSSVRKSVLYSYFPVPVWDPRPLCPFSCNRPSKYCYIGFLDRLHHSSTFISFFAYFHSTLEPCWRLDFLS